MWSAHKVDGRLAAKNSVKIRAALRQSIDSKDIYEEYLRTQPAVSDNITQDRARARAWAMLNVQVNLDPVTAALRKLYAEGYVLGEASAQEAIEKAIKRRDKSLTKADATIDWSTWKPGNKATALLLRPRGAFKKFLDAAGIVSKAIAKAGYDKIGNSIADSIAAGDSPAKAAKALADKISDPARALTIAITELNRATSAGSLDTYEAAEIEEVQWAALEPCDICEENDGQIVRLGQPFNSGDYQPPAHPNCRCALLPVVLGWVDDPSLGQDYLKFVLNKEQPRDAKGRFGSTTDKPEATSDDLYANTYPPSSAWDGSTRADDLRGTPVTEKEMRETYKDFEPSEEGRAAFEDYQETGFYELNRDLRAGEPPNDTAREMDEVFADAPQVSGYAREYYRSTEEAVFEGMKPGTVFVDDGYTSTSISKTEAATFGEDSMYDARVRIVDVHNQPKVYMDGVSTREGSSQQEVVFQRGTAFTYVGKDKQGFHVLLTSPRRKKS